MKTLEKPSLKERRPLIQGIKPSNVERAVEEQFVYSKPNTVPNTVEPSEPQVTEKPTEEREGKGQQTSTISRVPLTTRVRTDFAAALKRASLQRQLNGEFPNTLQDILEEAMEPWLRSKGYLK
jgi:hypothetical protein